MAHMEASFNWNPENDRATQAAIKAAVENPPTQ
jgi:hypothetical protein